MKKTYRIKTNNQELFIRKQNESDATSRWIKFQKTRPEIECSIDKKGKNWRKQNITFLKPQDRKDHEMNNNLLPQDR